MNISEKTALKSYTLDQLEKLRSVNFSIIGENKILAYFAFELQVKSESKLSRQNMINLLGTDIPKQVVSKATKVARYVKENKSYLYNGASIVLSENDFYATGERPPIRDVMVTYGHIAKHESEAKKSKDRMYLKLLKLKTEKNNDI